MEDYFNIINQIKDQLTGNKDEDLAFLVGQSRQWINHQYEWEIIKATGRMINELLPEDEKKIMQEELNGIRGFHDNILHKVETHIAQRKLQTAEKLIKEVFKYDHLIKEDKVSIYLSFNNLMEYTYYVLKFHPEKEVHTHPFVNTKAYLTYGYLLFEMKKFDEALDILNKGLLWNPIDINLLFEKGEVFKQKKIGDSYKSTYDECLEYAFSSKTYSKSI